MSKKKSSWKHKLAAVLVSILMIVVVLLLGEAYCRLFTRINFLDNSRDLFTYNRYGKSYGNTPNFEGISFGEKFYTDADGFRVDPEYYSMAAKDAPAILLVGDSVSFGPGVDDNQTIAGHLRHLMAGGRIYNSSAIGYDTFDYKNVLQEVIKQKPDIKYVAIFYCFNDLNDLSAQQIKQQTSNDQPNAQNTTDQSIPRRINDFFRSRSKLYLLIKNQLQDTQMLYFQSDLGFYQKDENVQFGLQPIVDIKKMLDESGIKFKVFILPYEAQTRRGTPPDFFLPQEKIVKFFQAHGIDHKDLTSCFTSFPAPKELFLYGDPMHLSWQGHKLVADAVWQDWLSQNGIQISK